MPDDLRRTRYDIYADVVEIVSRKGLCSLTRISYGSNLPVDRAKKIVQFLVSHGFVRALMDRNHVKYRATKWGLEYLETYKRMQRFFAALEERVSVKIPEVTLPNRITTGYKALDNLLFGGIPKGYNVILTSPSCDEKDHLLRRFLKVGIEKEQTTFYITVEANLTRDVNVKEASNLYMFVCNPQSEKIVEHLSNIYKLKGVENLTEIGIALNSAFRQLDRSHEGPRRACIEIISDVLLQHQVVQTRRWLTRLLPQLKEEGFTTLAIMNQHMHSPREVHAILDLFEGEINIYEKETQMGLQKFLLVKKMYNQRYSEEKIVFKLRKL
ncbi:MAG: winged helix-turn-helix domain-containing protein [Candidatus Bathyarchaeota archaeon]|jgi:predicted transcriptional regulator/KaiC/GvpD/RAD55 family RecA-like ATPase